MAETLIVPLGRADEYLAFGSEGWAWVNLPWAVDLEVWIQVTTSPGNRLIVRGIWVGTVVGVTGRGLDRLPLGRIEAAVNAPALRERLLKRLSDDQLDSPAWSELPPFKDLAPPRLDEHVEAPKVRLRLHIPEGRRRPDAFYAKVADVYSSQEALSDRPAADIAEANGVPATTVARWVKEARRRGLMAPARRGVGHEVTSAQAKERTPSGRRKAAESSPSKKRGKQ